MARVAWSGLFVAACLVNTNSLAFGQAKASPERSKPQRNDAEGFPLPAGAVARLGTLRGVADKPISFLALSADGKQVAVLEEERDAILRIREVPSGKLLAEIPSSEEFPGSVALSLDFQKLAWNSSEGTVTVVELPTRKETILKSTGKWRRRTDVSFSSDGNTLIVIHSHSSSGRKGSFVDIEAYKWSLQDGTNQPVWKETGEEKYKVRNVVFSLDGKDVAYIKKKSFADDFEQEFVLEDGVTRQARLRVPLKNGVDFVMDFSPDGKLLALANEDSLQIIDVVGAKVGWSASYKDKIHRPKSRFDEIKEPWPERIVWLPGGYVGVFFQPGDLWTWNAANGAPARCFGLEATSPMAIARDVPVMAFTHDKRCLQFLDTSNGEILGPVKGHRNPPSVLFRNDGSLISWDQEKICHWIGNDWRLRATFDLHDKGQCYYFGPNQDFFARTIGTIVEARSLETGKVIREWKLKVAPDFVFLLPDGKTMAAGNLYQFSFEEPETKHPQRLFIRLLDISTGAQKEIPIPYEPREVKLCPNEPLLALKKDWEHVDILDTASGKLRPVADDKDSRITLLDFSADGKRVFFWSTTADDRDQILSSVSLSTGERLKHSPTDDIQAASFTPDSRFLVYSPVKFEWRMYPPRCAYRDQSPSKKIVVWDTTTNAARGRFQTSADWVKSISCSPDGRHFASGLYDSTILIWELPAH